MNPIKISMYARHKLFEGRVPVGLSMTFGPEALLISRMRLLVSKCASSAMPSAQDVAPFPSPPEIFTRTGLVPVLVLVRPDANVRMMAGCAWLAMHVLCIAGTAEWEKRR